MVRSFLTKKFSPKTERRLLALCKNNPELDRDIEKWNKAAVQYLVRKLKKEPDVVSDLEKAIKHKSAKTKCVPLSKVLDNRLLISHRRGLPQVIYCRMWRWPDLQSHHQIRAISTCQSSSEYLEDGVLQPPNSTNICVNPYHYERESPGPIDPILLGSRIPPDLSSSFEDSDHKGTRARPGITYSSTVGGAGPSNSHTVGNTTASRSSIITRETVRALLFPQTHFPDRDQEQHQRQNQEAASSNPSLPPDLSSEGTSLRQPTPGDLETKDSITTDRAKNTSGSGETAKISVPTTSTSVPTSSSHIPALKIAASDKPSTSQQSVMNMDSIKMEDSSKETSDPLDVPIDRDQLLEFDEKNFIQTRPDEYDQGTFDFLDRIIPGGAPSNEPMIEESADVFSSKDNPDDKTSLEGVIESPGGGSLIPLGQPAGDQRLQPQSSSQIPQSTSQQQSQHHYQSQQQQQSPQQQYQPTSRQQYQSGPIPDTGGYLDQYPPQHYQSYPSGSGTYYPPPAQPQQHSPQPSQQHLLQQRHSPQQNLPHPQQQVPQQQQQQQKQQQQSQQMQYQFSTQPPKQPLMSLGSMSRQPYHTRTEPASPFSFKQNRYSEAARAKHEQGSSSMMQTSYDPQGNVNVAPYTYQDQSQQLAYRQPQYQQPTQQPVSQSQALTTQPQCMPSVSYTQQLQYGQSPTTSSTATYTALYSPQQQPEMHQQQYQQMDYVLTNMDVLPPQTTYYSSMPGPASGLVDQSMEQMIDIQQVPFQEGTSWCSITYHEYGNRLGDKYQPTSSVISVDGYTQPMCSDRFCIGGLSNVNRNQFTEWVRRRIGRGVRMTYVDGEVYVESQCESAVFVSNPLLIEEQGGKYIEQVSKLNEGCSLKVFSTHQFSKLLSDSVSKGFEAVYKLTNCCIIRISFVKGWGRNYKRQSIFHTPCWVEVQLNGPLQWIDKVLRQMKPPAGCGTTSK